MDHTLYEVMIVNRDGEPLLEGHMARAAIEQALLDYSLCVDRPNMLMVQAVAAEGFLMLENGYGVFIKQAR